MTPEWSVITAAVLWSVPGSIDLAITLCFCNTEILFFSSPCLKNFGDSLIYFVSEVLQMLSILVAAFCHI